MKDVLKYTEVYEGYIQVLEYMKDILEYTEEY